MGEFATAHTQLAQAQLWERVRSGFADAREELGRLASSLARAELVRRRAAPGDLDDLAQEAVRSTLAYVERGGPAPTDLSAFLKYRAWGVLSDHRKRQRATPMHALSAEAFERPDPARGPSERSERLQVLETLRDCRSRLSAEQRQTVELRYLEGLEGEAIAARLGVHRNTVHVRVHRALLALRECLERKGLRREDAQP
jgi:RNA polymerase sigma-70 factor (ECF subfamily)